MFDRRSSSASPSSPPHSAAVMSWQLVLLLSGLPIATALSSCYTPEVSRTARAVLVPQYSTTYANCSADCDEMSTCLAFYYNEVIDKCALLGELQTAMNYCPAGPPPTVQVKCVRDVTTPEMIDRTDTTTIPQEYTPDITNGTTTIRIDVSAAGAQLVALDQYYSPTSARHGFCVAEGNCLSTIKKQIGAVPQKTQLGKVIRASAIEAVRAQCPIESKHLVYLGFTYNSGDKSYQHNFNGAGLQQGYVSTVKGACGATRVVNWFQHTLDKHNFYGTNMPPLYKKMQLNVFYNWNQNA